jgi:hypothetical protein
MIICVAKLIGCKGTTRLPGAGVITKKDGSYFGPHKTLTNTSSRKTSPKKESKGSFHYEDTYKRPGIPKVEDRPVMGIVSNKNYVTANAVEAILMGML